MGNTFKTALLLTAMTLFLLFLGQFFGGARGLQMALFFAVIMNFVSYFFSDKIALSMYRAQPVTREQLPRAYAVVERLSQKMGIPMPKIYVIPTDSPHELGHVRNRDILISSVAATLAGAITFLAHMGFFFGGMGGDREDREGGG